MERSEDYATIYNPAPHNKNAIVHFCINYKDTKHVKNYSLSGSALIIEVKNRCNCDIFDISNATKIIGLNKFNLLKYNAKQIRFNYDQIKPPSFITEKTMLNNILHTLKN